jgi:hypothetical protein
MTFLIEKMSDQCTNTAKTTRLLRLRAYKTARFQAQTRSDLTRDANCNRTIAHSAGD